MTVRDGRRIRRSLALLGAAALVLVVAGLVAVRVVIDSSVQEIADDAQRRFGPDRVSALVRLANAIDQPLRDRNRAVWALGELQDPRAIPELDALRTGEPCNHDRFVCQYQVQKAIEKCRGERTFAHDMAKLRDKVFGRAAP